MPCANSGTSQGQNFVALRVAAIESITSACASIMTKEHGDGGAQGVHKAPHHANNNTDAGRTPSEDLSGKLERLNRRVVELETALEDSERRFARTSASLPHLPSNVEGVAGGEVIPNRGDARLLRALGEAETCVTWLRGELKMLSACSAQHIQELEEALAARYDKSSGVGDQSASCGDTSIPPPPVGVGKLDETNKVLQSLRGQFFRVLRERNELRSKCDDLSEELQARTWDRDRLAHELGRASVRRRSRTSRRGSKTSDERSASVSTDTAALSPSSHCEAPTGTAPAAAPDKDDGLFVWRWPSNDDAAIDAPAWGKD